MKRATLLIGLFLMLSPMGARADSVLCEPNICSQVGPTWQVTAAGIFSGVTGGESEAFALDWTVTFELFDGFFLQPVYSGTTTMVGVLGTVNETMQNAFFPGTNSGLGFLTPAAQAEIDIRTTNYYPYGQTPLSLSYVTANPPIMEVPFVYSCLVAPVCEAFGVPTGYGLNLGEGAIVQSVREVPVATPEPGSLLLLLSAALFGLPFVRRHKGHLAQCH